MIDIAGPSQWDIQDMPETPGPIRARVNNLHNQVTELVRKEHANSVSHLSSLVDYHTEMENTGVE